MKPSSSIIAITAALVLCAASPSFARVIDGVVAVVNNEPVTFSEVRDVVSEGLGVTVGDADAYLREEKEVSRILQWVTLLVDSALVRQELTKAGRGVSDKEIDQTVDYLRQQNKMTEKEFEEALARDGMTLAVYRRKIRWQMERSNIVRSVKGREIAVTREEALDFHRKNAARFTTGGDVRFETLHIPLPTAVAQDEGVLSVRVAAKRAADALKAGMSLAEVAKLLAPSHPGTTVIPASFAKVDDLSEEISRETVRLSAGESSPPFFTAAGAFVVGVLERRGGTPIDFSSVIDAIIEELTDRRSESAYASIIADLRRKAVVDVRL